MPESRKRQNSRPQPEPAKTPKKKGPSPRWLVPLMLTLFIVGIVWLVVYYLAPSNPVMDPLGGWNLAVGFSMIVAGMLLATQWR